MRNAKFIPALKYNWATPYYDSFIKVTMPEKKVKKEAITLAEISKDDCVLDFGFGTGTSILMLAKEHPKARIYGFEVDEKIIKIARKKFDSEGISVHIFMGDLALMPSKSMDKVISTWVFHHLTYVQKLDALKEIYRILKPRGILVIGDWGKPRNLLMSVLFFILQLADNFKTTQDNREGRMSEFLCQSGFEDIVNDQYQNTIFGTFWFWKANKN